MSVKILGVLACLLSLTGCATTVVNSHTYAPSAKPNESSAVGLAYALPRALIPLIVKADFCASDKTFRGNYSYELGNAQLVPDGNIFMLTHPHWLTSDDNLTFTTSNGLLTSVHTISDDKTGEIIERVGNIYKEIVVGEGVAKGSQAPGGILPLAPCSPLTREVFTTQSFDIFDAISVNAVQAAVSQLTSEHITLGVGPDGASGRLAKPAAATGSGDAVFYRPLANYDVYISKDGTVINVGHFTIPDQLKLTSIEVQRQNFTKAETTLSFTNGILETEAYIHNNPLSGAAQTGLTTVQTVFSIPHAIIAGIVVGTGDEKGLLDAKTKNLTAQKDLLDASTANLKAKKDLEDATTKPSGDNGPPVS